MGLFVIDTEYVGQGLPMWLPKGAAIVEELEKLAKETEFAAGYVRVKTPHLAREKMYTTSGHLPYYAESMFPPMTLEVEGAWNRILQRFDKMLYDIDHLFGSLVKIVGKLPDSDQTEDKPTPEMVEALLNTVARQFRSFSQTDQAEVSSASQPTSPLPEQADKLYQNPKIAELLTNYAKARVWIALLRASEQQPERYYLKAMNCPHHHRIFAAEPRSYRDLPLRLAEYGCNYRYEQSGELFGLMRVRSLNMNDAHIYCTEDQFAAEFNAVNEMYLKYFKIFGIEKYVMRFSTHGKEGLGKKYVNEPELWLKTEDMVRQVLIDSKINYVEVPNEAAFYGPKIDVQVWSVIGREFTLATNQVDFAVPARFGLVYRDRDNTDKTPLCIHRAPLGTHERFIGFLIEHYAGNFPLWLAPDQVRVITLTDDAALIDYAQPIVNELRANMVRASADFTATPVKAKIADAESARVHTMLVIGPRDVQAGHVSVRLHSQGHLGAKAKAEVVTDILAAVRERRP